MKQLAGQKVSVNYGATDGIIEKKNAAAPQKLKKVSRVESNLVGSCARPVGH